MLARVLAVLGVGIWCFFLLFASLGMIIDRGLADVGIAWVGLLGIGVVAPVLLFWQINRAIAAHEASRHAVPDAREKEKDLLGVLEERRELTPATAAMRTSLTVDEASKLLEDLSRKGHLGLRTEDGVMAYALGERGGRGPSGNIYRKLGTKNSAEALAHARDLKLLTRASPIEIRTDRAGVALGRSARRRRPG